jgi:hypothetical protein
MSGKSGDWIRGMIPSHIETFVSDHRGSPNPVGGPLYGPLLMLKAVYCLTGIRSSGKTNGVIRPVETPKRSCTKIRVDRSRGADHSPSSPSYSAFMEAIAVV